MQDISQMEKPLQTFFSVLTNEEPGITCKTCKSNIIQTQTNVLLHKWMKLCVNLDHKRQPEEEFSEVLSTGLTLFLLKAACGGGGVADQGVGAEVGQQ